VLRSDTTLYYSCKQHVSIRKSYKQRNYISNFARSHK